MRAIALCGLCSAFVIVLARANGFSDEQEKRTIDFWPTEPSDLPMQVPIGSGHDAVFYTLMMLSKETGYTLRMVDSGNEWPEIANDEEEPFDAECRIRWTNATDQSDQKDYCFFFRRGFLVGKCPAPVGQNLELTKIFEQEIASGLHHPPKYPDLLSHVTWGPATGCRLFNGDANNNRKPNQRPETDENLHGPRLRCGIAVTSLPPFARRNKLNVVLLIQNVDAQPLGIRVPWQGFVVGAIRLAAFEKGRDEKAAPKVEGGTALTMLKSGVPGRLYLDDMRLAPIKLEPRQCTWFWFSSTVFGDAHLALRAEVHLLGADSENRVRDYRLSCEIPSTMVKAPNGP